MLKQKTSHTLIPPCLMIDFVSVYLQDKNLPFSTKKLGIYTITIEQDIKEYWLEDQ